MASDNSNSDEPHFGFRSLDFSKDPFRELNEDDLVKNDPGIWTSHDWAIDGERLTPDHFDMDQVDKLQQNSLARQWITQATDQMKNYYDWWWSDEKQEFRGIFIDPSGIIEQFELVLDHDFDEAFSPTVRFQLQPEPRFQWGTFEAYGIKLLPGLDEDGSINYCGAKVFLHGVDLFEAEEDHGDPLFNLADPCDMLSDYDAGRYNIGNHLFYAASEKDELWWHRVFMRSLLYHTNLDGANSKYKAIQALMRVGRLNELPSEEEFTKTLDKIKLVEGLG